MKKRSSPVQEAHTLNKIIKTELYLQYLLHLPPGAAEGQTGKKWPVLFSLHGGGERGDELERLKLAGIPQVVEATPDFQFITVSPQCPLNTWWSNEFDALDSLFDTILDRYPADNRRVYLTGYSMGGYGTWHWAAQRPQRFAAIAPICGGGHWSGGFPERVMRLKNVPVWAFHGKLDTVVRPKETRQLVKLLVKSGGNVRYTEYPDLAHDCWTATYNNPEFYEWLLAQKLP